MTYTVAEAERILAEAKAREALLIVAREILEYLNPQGDEIDVNWVVAKLQALAPAQPSPAPSEEDDLRLAREAAVDPLQIEAARKGE